jgi:hypothetical protein
VTGSAGGLLRWRRAGLFAGLVLSGALVGYLARRDQGGSSIVNFKPITFRSGLVNDARFAPDGKTIVYQALWPGAPPDVYVTQAGSPESRPLGVGAVGLGGVSKAGDLLIGRPTGNLVTLAQVPMGGGAPRDILQNTAGADFGPDGISVAALRVVGSQMHLEFPVGKLLHESGSMRHVRVAPDGKHVAFTDHPFALDFRGDIAVVDTDGKKTTLSADWADIRGLAWSADGREIWFTATRSGAENSLWAVTLDGRLRPVFRGPGSLALRDIAPDGRVLVAVQRRRLQLFGLAPGEAKERELSWLDYGIAVDISLDGRTLLFQEQGEGGGSEYTAYIRGMDGSLPARLGKGAALALSPDGTLALVVNLALPMQAVLLPTGAGELRPLPRGALTQIHSAAFLPDGKRVVLFANEQGQPPRFYLQELAGGDPKAISGEGYAQGFVIPTTPDGAWFVAARQGQVVLHPTAGGEPRGVPGTAPDDIPLRVSRDGRYLFVHDSVRKIFRVDLARSTRQLWREILREGGPAAFLRGLVISPDGNAYAYVFREDTSTLYVGTGLR